MQPFSYLRVDRVEDAITAIQVPRSRFIAGGTNLVDLMKGGVEQPVLLVDITHLPLTSVTEAPDGGVRVGALARNSDLANHPLIRTRYPLLSQAFLAGASPQLRNMASVGGNLMQRTRCGYFTDAAFPACNKRAPGTGCGALLGYNRTHAIFGASDQCVATHPSDMCVALAALDATVTVQSARGERQIALTDFHRLPGATPQRDTVLAPDELIVGVYLPPAKPGTRSHYLKVRDRASYAFALVSVATVVRLSGDRVDDARIVLGGVAHKPWRVIAAERALVGRSLDPVSIDAAARVAIEGARPLKDNRYKVELARQSVARALRVAGGVA
jgi:xanthine dehydrogenase YagS FAD-binding subunit